LISTLFELRAAALPPINPAGKPVLALTPISTGGCWHCWVSQSPDYKKTPLCSEAFLHSVLGGISAGIGRDMHQLPGLDHR
jgi:hypothetical protein